MKLRKSYKKAKKELKEFGGQSFRPELPGPGNAHKFPHHGLFTKTGGKPFNNPKLQSNNPKGDLEVGDATVEDAEKIEELPESNSLKELFKFSISGKDNTDFQAHTTGRGFPSAYGRGLTDYQSFDPQYKKTKKKERFNTLKGREFQRPKRAGSIINKLTDEELTAGGKEDVSIDSVDEGLNYRDAGTGGGFRTTKQPYSSGVPGRDKKDIKVGYEKVDELIKILKKEKDIKKQNKKKIRTTKT